MLIDIVELPNRYDPVIDTTLNTTMPCFKYDGSIDDIDWYGREIPLEPFGDNKIFKYKTIERIGQNTVERIFVTDEQIDLKKSFWTSNQSVYPVQMKMFNMQDPMIGTTIKYVNGIADANQQLLNFDGRPEPVVIEQFAKNNVSKQALNWDHNPYSVIIPSLDSNLVENSIFIPMMPKVNGIDHWVNRDLLLKNITHGISSDFMCHPAISQSLEHEVEDGGLCNTDPFNMNWSMYNLIMFLNDLAVTDIRIEANAYDHTINVAFSSRYSGLFDYSHIPGYENLCTKISFMMQEVLNDRYREDPWTRIVIEKLWSEEVYITMNVSCPGRSSSIETYHYIDLPVFLLGTVGLK